MFWVVVVYLCVGFLWGLYALKKQREVYPNSGMGHVILAFLLNYFFWPIGMILAIMW